MFQGCYLVYFGCFSDKVWLFQWRHVVNPSRMPNSYWRRKAVSLNVAAMVAHVVRGYWGQHVLLKLRACMRANFISLRYIAEWTVALASAGSFWIHSYYKYLSVRRLCLVVALLGYQSKWYCILNAIPECSAVPFNNAQLAPKPASTHNKLTPATASEYHFTGRIPYTNFATTELVATINVWNMTPPSLGDGAAPLAN